MQAERLRREAEAQLELLVDERTTAPQATSTATATSPARGSCPATTSPGCRCPRSSPARPAEGSDEFVSRPRFLAISEFGPRTIVYHEGVALRDQPGHPAAARRRDRLADRPRPSSAPPAATSTSALDAGDELCQRCGARLDGGRFFANLFRHAERLDHAARPDHLRRGGAAALGLRDPAPPFSSRETSRTGRIADASQLRARRRGVGAGSPTARRDPLAHQPRLAAAQGHGGTGVRARPRSGHWSSKDPEALRSENATRKRPTTRTRTQRVVPFVEDRRNASCSCFRRRPRHAERLPACSTRLKRAIQALPARGQRARRRAAARPPRPAAASCFYEAAEGAPGCCRRLAHEPQRSGRGGAGGAGALPLRSRDRRGPAPSRAGGAEGLRGGLLRLPAHLRQPARPPRSSTGTAVARPAAGAGRRAWPKRPASASHGPRHAERLLRRSDSELERALRRVPGRAGLRSCRTNPSSSFADVRHPPRLLLREGPHLRLRRRPPSRVSRPSERDRRGRRPGWRTAATPWSVSPTGWVGRRAT